MLLITLKLLIMMTQVPQCFVAWIIIIKIFNVINSIPVQATSFHHSLFSDLGWNFFTARVVLVGIAIIGQTLDSMTTIVHWKILEGKTLA